MGRIEEIVVSFETGMITQSEFVEEVLMAVYESRSKRLAG